MSSIALAETTRGLQGRAIPPKTGDRVLVMPSNHFGVYSLTPTFGSINLLGKSITVESAEGAAVTRISGTNLPGQPGILIGSGGPTTVFRGFTVENCDHGTANGDRGGAILIQLASPTVEDCVLVGNRAFAGAGLYTSQSNAMIRNCVFSGNDAVHQGGGAYTDAGNPQFVGCTFSGNQADFGGAFLSRTQAGLLVTVSDSLFEENVARVGYAGGLAKFDTGDILLQRCRFLRNQAAGAGGGTLNNGSAWFRSCLFDSNESMAGVGGGLATGSTGGVITVYGCTLTGNVGGGIAELDPGTPTITEVRNSIVWGNNGLEVGVNIDVQYTNILGGYGGVGNNRAVNHPRPDTGIALVGQVADMGAFELGSSCVRVRRGTTQAP